jgi:hypothetical protein
MGIWLGYLVLEDDAAEGKDEREKRVDKVLW